MVEYWEWEVFFPRHLLSIRTSPVIRGKWVLEQLMGISPPPPPPLVAELTEDETAHSELGLRKILELHRSKPDCQSCHEKMDPLGLGLENFDPTGRWRNSYGKAPVDPSGVMADGRKFQGPAELKILLLRKKQKLPVTYLPRCFPMPWGGQFYLPMSRHYNAG